MINVLSDKPRRKKKMNGIAASGKIEYGQQKNEFVSKGLQGKGALKGH